MSPLLAGSLLRDGAPALGWVRVEAGRIAEVGAGPPPSPPDEDVDGLVAPGLVDLQVNGAAGHEVTGDDAALDTIEAALTARGVTSFLATVVTTDDETATRAVARLAERVADPASAIAGIHLEGPFLSREHAGTHRAELLRAPADGVPAYVEHPAVRVVTLAPELPGALELIARLRAHGVVVSLGHSGADAATATRAIDAGASLVTHLFNAMGPLHHRAPGLAGAALVDERVSVGVIADGVHVDATVLALVRRAAGNRVVLVSDSSPAAAAPPGRYAFAGAMIERGEDGDVRDPEGRLAGSAITLDEAVGGWMRLAGATLADAATAANERPARAAGLGAPWRPGAPADLVVLDDDGRVRRVMRSGAWLPLL